MDLRCASEIKLGLGHNALQFHLIIITNCNKNTQFKSNYSLCTRTLTDAINEAIFYRIRVAYSE